MNHAALISPRQEAQSAGLGASSTKSSGKTLHAGPQVSGIDPVPGAEVLTGPGHAPARSERRVNGVLMAVRGLVVHAVAPGSVPWLSSLVYLHPDPARLCAAVNRPGLVSVRGLPPGLIIEILFGLADTLIRIRAGHSHARGQVEGDEIAPEGNGRGLGLGMRAGIPEQLLVP